MLLEEEEEEDGVHMLYEKPRPDRTAVLPNETAPFDKKQALLKLGSTGKNINGVGKVHSKY